MSLLQLKQVELILPYTGKKILQGIDYTVYPGDFVILLGSNGSGKTTLLKLLHRDYQLNHGEINLLNKPLADYSTAAFSERVSILTQNCLDSLFPSLTLYENYLLVNRSKTKCKLATRQAFCEYLKEFNPNLSKKLDTVIERLSGGEKQALALALCLLNPPTLLLLDEHTSALDPKTSEQIMALTYQMATKHNITCILTTHNLDIAMRYGNRILVLKNGEVFKVFEKAQEPHLTKEMLGMVY